MNIAHVPRGFFKTSFNLVTSWDSSCTFFRVSSIVLAFAIASPHLVTFSTRDFYTNSTHQLGNLVPFQLQLKHFRFLCQTLGRKKTERSSVKVGFNPSETVAPHIYLELPEDSLWAVESGLNPDQGTPGLWDGEGRYARCIRRIEYELYVICIASTCHIISMCFLHIRRVHMPPVLPYPCLASLEPTSARLPDSSKDAGRASSIAVPTIAGWFSETLVADSKGVKISATKKHTKSRRQSPRRNAFHCQFPWLV